MLLPTIAFSYKRSARYLTRPLLYAFCQATSEIVVTGCITHVVPPMALWVP